MTVYITVGNTGEKSWVIGVYSSNKKASEAGACFLDKLLAIENKRLVVAEGEDFDDVYDEFCAEKEMWSGTKSFSVIKKELDD